MTDVDRWLLLHLPVWALFLVFGVALELAAAIALRLFRRYVRPAKGDHNEVLAVILSLVVGVYGVLLGFVIVTLWTEYENAESTVAAEATSLTQIGRSVQFVFPTAQRDMMNAAIKDYVHDLETTAFPIMAAGGSSDVGKAGELYRALSAIEPEGSRQEAAYAQMTSSLADLVEQNRMRRQQADGSMPGIMKLLVVIGAAATLGSLFLLSIPSQSMHTYVVVTVTEVLGLALLLALVLEYPFIGSVRVSLHPYNMGLLKVIAH